MEKKTTKWGRIVSLGLLGATLVAAIAIPSALAKNAVADTAAGQTVRQQRGPESNGGGPLFNMEDVTVTIEYLDNGVRETFVSRTQSVISQMAQMVKRINDRQENRDDAADITVVAEAASTGMVITTTSADADTALRIINQTQIRELQRKLREAGVDIQASITRTVTNTENGVVITLSSDNADVAKLLQLREQYGPPGPREGMGMQRGNRPELPPGQFMKGPRGNRGGNANGQQNANGTQDVTP